MNRNIPRIARLAAAALAVLALAAAFVLRFSYSTSFLYPGYCGFDSAIFQTIGKYWAEGVTPYARLFDHKGPLIFFVDAVGYWLHGRAGILVVQTVSLAVTVWGLYRLGRTGLSRPWTAGAVALALVYLARTFDEGNMTEEYSLPFLAVSLYLAARWCLARKRDPAAPHPWQWAAVYGASFAAILMLRVTSAVAVCSYVLVIALALLAGRQWKNLLANMGGFLGGFALLTGPFAVYFACKGSLADMLYGTIGYNIGRQWKNLLANMGGFLGGFALLTGPFAVYFACKGSLADMLYGTIGYNIFYATEFSIREYYANSQWAASTLSRVLTDFGAPLFLLAVLCIAALVRGKNDLLAWGGLLSGALSMYVLFTNRPYVHYFMIVTPLIPLAFVLAAELVRGSNGKKLALAAPVLCALWAVSLLIRLPGWSTDSFMAKYPYETQSYNNAARAAVAVIPKEERDSVLGYNVDAQWYLAADIQPCQRYFIHQDWQAAEDPSMRSEIDEFLTKDPPKWLVVSGPVEDTVQQLLDEQYTAVSGEQQFTDYASYVLYRRNS